MKGLYLQFGMTVYRGTKSQMVKLLKGIAKGGVPGDPLEGFVEVGPILFSLNSVKPEDARKLFTDVQLGEE